MKFLYEIITQILSKSKICILKKLVLKQNMPVVNLTITTNDTRATLVGDDSITYLDIAWFPIGVPPATMELLVQQNFYVFFIQGLGDQPPPIPKACYNVVRWNDNTTTGITSLTLKVTSPASGTDITGLVPGPITASIDYDPSVVTNQWTNTFCCAAEGTLVTLASGAEIPIEQLASGSLLCNHRGRSVRVEQVIRFAVPNRRFVRIKRSALGQHQPSADLLIREGHPLLIQGLETLPESLLGSVPGIERADLEQPLHIYTLVTEQKQFVEMQGLLVATWSSSAWAHETASKHMLFESY